MHAAGELEAPREGEARVEEEEWGTDDDWTLQPLVELLQSSAPSRPFLDLRS